MTRTIATITFIAIAGIALVGSARPHPAATAEASTPEAAATREPVVPIAPAITYRDDPAPEDLELVDWAIGRYVDAGLQLPDLQVAFPVTCGGKAGRYVVGKARIEVCHPSRKIVLHELAHAWDDHVDIDRQAFMAHRGLEHWYESDCDSDEQSAGEELALVIAWGLMEVDVTARNPEYAGQPVDEQPRYLPGMDDSSPAVLHELFEMTTGTAALTPSR